MTSLHKSFHLRLSWIKKELLIRKLDRKAKCEQRSQTYTHFFFYKQHFYKQRRAEISLFWHTNIEKYQDLDNETNDFTQSN